MQHHRLFPLSLVILGSILASALALAEPTAPQRSLIELPERFDHVRFLPSGRRALVVSQGTGRALLIDLDEQERAAGFFEIAFELGHPVNDLVVNREGTFAYFVGAASEVAPRAWRVNLDDSTKDSQLLPPEFMSPMVALGDAGQLIVASRGSRLLVRLNPDKFEKGMSPGALRDWSRDAIPVGFPMAGISAVPGEGLQFAWQSDLRKIFGMGYPTGEVGSKVQIEDLATLPQARGADEPIALVAGSRTGPSDPGVLPAAAVCDAATNRVSLFAFNRSFRTLDFVTDAKVDLAAEGKGATPPLQGRETLIMRASRDLSLIVVGNRQGRRVYFLAPQDKLLGQLSVWSSGQPVDIDVTADGRGALILTNGGSSLLVIRDANQPEAGAGDSAFSSAVREDQVQLGKLGYLVGAADGINGPATVRALKAFQKSQGLQPTGIADETTRRILMDQGKRERALALAPLDEYLKDQGIRYFKAEELVSGSRPGTTRPERSTPPRVAWCGLVTVARVLDELRGRWGYPLLIEPYVPNPSSDDDAEPAAPPILTINFGSSKGSPPEWLALLNKMSDEELFESAVSAAIQGDVIHLEVRQTPELWVLIGKSSKDQPLDLPYFPNKEVPNVGETIVPTTTMNLRSSGPRKAQDGWISGESISFLNGPSGLLVEEVRPIEDAKGITRYWAGGKVVFNDSEPAGTADRRWFVVLGSYSIEANALKRARELRASHPGLPIDMYLADNRYYAVVGGANLDQGEAKRRTLDARCHGISDDAYMWPSKTWTRSDKVQAGGSP